MSAPPLEVSSTSADQSSLHKAAREDLKQFWMRLPPTMVASSFLFGYISTPTGIAWLGALIALELVGYYCKLRFINGCANFRWGIFAGVVAVSICWVVYSILLWRVGEIVPQVAAVMGLFSTALYSVMSSYRNRAIMLGLLTLPLFTMSALLVSYLWEHTSASMAAFGSLSTLGACALIALNGFTLSASYSRELLNAERLKASEEKYRIAAAQADAANSAKSEFLANIGHELRTPLTSIIGFGELLLEDISLSDRAKGFANIVQDAGNSLLAIINDVLDYSASEAGALHIAPEPTEIHAIAAEVISLLTIQAERKNVQLQLSYTPQVQEHRRLVDPKRLRQLFWNLIGNAIKFTDVGIVRVELDIAASSLICKIIDTGIGIAPDQTAKLFSRFSQVDNTVSRLHGGTGLGLAICRGIVQASGGNIGLSSRLNEGSTFWFDIPAPLESPPSLKLGAIEGLNPASPPRILIADDDDIIRRFLRIAIPSIGMTCIDVSSGEEAVRLASEQSFDLIMLDVRMPGMSGDAAMRKIRTGPMASSTRIIAFTGEGDNGRIASLISEGFDAVLRKPVSIQTLKEFILQQLRIANNSRHEPPSRHTVL